MITIQSFEFNFFSVNTYLLHDETREAVLIDCGCYGKEEEAAVSAYLTANGLTLKYLLCTHLHLDHILGNGFIYGTYGVKPLAHKADAETLPSARQQGRRFGISSGIVSVPFERYLIDNETLRFGASELIVRRVPGHSPGSLMFYNRKEGIAFVGDVIFNRSIGRTDLWGGNHEVLIAAIKAKILSLPDATVLYPGHGAATNVIDERLNNPFL
ncbi:MAG: MBL fold hydrolase [Bacteroidales bacterium]